MNSHLNSMPFLVNNLRQFFIEIHTKFHDDSMSFIQVLFVSHVLKHGMDFGGVQVMAISEAFAKKMMKFPSDLV